MTKEDEHGAADESAVDRSYGAELESYRPARKLGTVIALVAAAVIAVGGATFLWLTWLLSGSAAPWSGGWVSWLGKVPPPGWTIAAVASTALVLSLTAAVVAALAVRKQAVVENKVDLDVAAHATAVDQVEISALAQRTAARHLQVAQDQASTDQERLELQSAQLEEQKRRGRSAEENALRARFTESATLLSNPHIAVRMAGAYALASVADDWHVFGNDDERQASVSLLCDQLRVVPPTESDFELHRTIVALIRQHRPLPTSKGKGGAHSAAEGRTWTDCTLDLSGAYMPGVNLIDTDLRNTTLYRAILTGATLANSLLVSVSAAGVDLDSANLVGVDASNGDFRRARMTKCWMTGANFSRTELTEAQFAGADMTKVDMTQATVDGADMSTAEMAEAKIDSVTHDAATRWPSSEAPARVG